VKFWEVAQIVEASDGFPLTEMRVAPEGVIAVITATTPDDKPCNATLYFGPEQLAEEELMRKLTVDACEALQRYVDSFVPPVVPKWDQQLWGP